MLEDLCHYIWHADAADFQPMKANYGILPALSESGKPGKRERARRYSARALEAIDAFITREITEAAHSHDG
jgi:methylenetetrahydrofolate--tRNA-(uracil-5-)-methyltransferase